MRFSFGLVAFTRHGRLWVRVTVRASEIRPGDGAFLFVEPVQGRDGSDGGAVTVRSWSGLGHFQAMLDDGRSRGASGHRRLASKKWPGDGAFLFVEPVFDRGAGLENGAATVGPILSDVLGLRLGIGLGLRATRLRIGPVTVRF